MEIISKLVEIDADLPIDNNYIEAMLAKLNIYPLRWAIVGVNQNKLIITLAHEVL